MAFNQEHFGEKILEKLDFPVEKPDMKKWVELMNNIDGSLDVLRIGMIGKYVGLEDAYYSLNE